MVRNPRIHFCFCHVSYEGMVYKGWAVCYISEIFDRLLSCGGGSSRSASFSTVCLEVIGKVLEALAAHSLALLSSRLPSL